jgi:tetratricopeptide (TPR) repeat protein
MKKKLLWCICTLGFSSFISAQSLDEAKKLTENEQYESASAIYQSLISREPANMSFYYFYGENLLLGDNADSAKIIFDRGQQTDPANALLKIGQAKVLMNSSSAAELKAASDKDPSNTDLKQRYQEAAGNVSKAMSLIDEALTNTPAKSALLQIEAADALIHFKNKNLDKAKQLLDKAVTIEPKNPDIQILYGDIYTELNNGTLAADYYNKALDLNKNSARAIVSKGRLYKRSTNYDGAAIEFENAIKIDPGYAPAYRELGETSFKQGKLTKAKENYRHYLDLSKNNCSARIRYSYFLYLSKDYAGALTEISQLRDKCDPNDKTLLRVSSYCYYETKDFVKGLESINKLFSILSEDKRIANDYEYRGKLLAENKQDSLGILDLRKAYEMEPARTDLLSEIGNIYYKIKKYNEAIQTYTEEINTGKSVKAADFFNLGRSYFFSSMFPQADSAFMKVNELSPKYASGWLWRAKTNTHIDTTSQEGLAKPFYEQYIEIAVADSANPAKYQSGLAEAYGYLAFFYIIKNDKANALIYLKKKAELPLEPEDKKNVQQAIDQLEGKKPGR